MIALAGQDIIRCKRVGEIFGEGCITTAKDYAAAALIFQHGDTPDYFYQAFIWSQQGVAKGDNGQKHLMALAIDRYLVHTGKKQLFASQAFSHNEKKESCYCLEPTELSFSDQKRKEYTGRTLQDAFEWINLLNTGKDCSIAAECVKKCHPTPAGSIPGFW